MKFIPGDKFTPG